MVAVGRISLILSNRHSRGFSGHSCAFFSALTLWCFNWVIVNCHVFPLSLLICLEKMIRERKTAWRQNTEAHVHVAGVFFLSLFFGWIWFSDFSKGKPPVGVNLDWLLWRGGGREGPSQTWSPVKNSAGFPPPQSRGISSGPGGYCWSSRGFSSALITSEGMVAAPQIHATLSKCLAFFASWLVIERDADCSTLQPLFSWRFVPRSYCKCWKRGPGPCWFFLNCSQPRFHWFEKMRKYFNDLCPI